MADVTLKAERRQGLGTAASKRLRAENKIPCVLYGHGGENVPLAVAHDELVQILEHGVRTFDLELGKEREHAFVKDVAHNALGTDVLHVDFVRVMRGQKIEVRVAVRVVGHAKGVAEGGMLEEMLADLLVECSADAIPEEIRADVSELAIGGHLRAGELALPEGVVLKEDAEALVATVKEPRVVAEAGEEAAVEGGPGEPEVIGAKKEGEEEAPEAGGKA
jgi:large subunit ribosomal protein L25